MQWYHLSLPSKHGRKWLKKYRSCQACIYAARQMGRGIYEVHTQDKLVSRFEVVSRFSIITLLPQMQPIPNNVAAAIRVGRKP